jgi:serine/threonine-protein kinase
VNVGTQIGQYKVVGALGAGGMGTVLLAEHVLLGRRAAIKTLLPELSRETEIVERFFNEARATSAITDPGVVQIFDFGYTDDGHAYIVMELLSGESLAMRMEHLGPMPVQEALRIVRQCAASLGAAHEQGIVHRDLKPENIFLVHDAEAQGGERTKVLDFGICKLDGTSKVKTQSGVTMGTPVYMSPEQCRGAAAVDHRSDIYALGCVLFHMLTGEPPFDGEGTGDIIAAHVRDTAPLCSSLRPTIPASVNALVMRCLEKKPENRFASMEELRAAIETIQASLSSPPQAVSRMSAQIGIPLPSGFRSNGPTSTKWNASDAPHSMVDIRPRRRRGLLAGAVAAMAMVIVAVAAFAWPDEVPAHAATTTTAPATPTELAAPTPVVAAPAGVAAPAPTVAPPAEGALPVITAKTIEAAPVETPTVTPPVEATTKPKAVAKKPAKSPRSRARAEKKATTASKEPTSTEDLYETR